MQKQKKQNDVWDLGRYGMEGAEKYEKAKSVYFVLLFIYFQRGKIEKNLWYLFPSSFKRFRFWICLEFLQNVASTDKKNIVR